MAESTALKDNLDLIRLHDKEIYLVGTAHVSKSSEELVETTIREVQPDCIAVELCDSRYQSLKDPERWKNTDLFSIIRSGRSSVLLAQLILAGYQKRMGDKLNIRPGAEMMKALSLADELKVKTTLADRDVRTTLKRTWSALSFWQTLKLPFTVLMNLSAEQEIDEKEIERLKSSDGLEEVMREFSEAFPAVRNALIDERDRYLSRKIADAPGKKIVAIVGAGHVPGIKRQIGAPIDLAELEVIPRAKLSSKIISWLIPVLVVGMIVAGFFFYDLKTSYNMVVAWFWITGISAAIGSAICLAHPLTILTAFVTAPITTLHPLLASGWFAGLVEAAIKKPRVSDLETILVDINSVRGLWRNRVSRTLLVVAFTNLAGSIGMVIGTKVVASML
jgi:pheromone shutdown-related protein TraB